MGGAQLGAKGPSFLSCCRRTPPPTASRVGHRPGSVVGPRRGWKNFPSCDPSPFTYVSPHHGERAGRLTPGHPGRSRPELAPCLPRSRDQKPRCSDPGCPQPSDPAPVAPWPQTPECGPAHATPGAAGVGERGRVSQLVPVRDTRTVIPN